MTHIQMMARVLESLKEPWATKKDSDPGTPNGPGDIRGGSNKHPMKDDPPLSSFRGNQIQEADGVGVMIGSIILRPGDQ